MIIEDTSVEEYMEALKKKWEPGSEANVALLAQYGPDAYWEDE